MKIIISTPDFNIGGITTALGNFTDFLVKQGHEVDIVNLPGKSLPESFNKNVHLVPLSGKARYWNLSAADVLKDKGIRRVPLLLFGCFKKIANRMGSWFPYIFNQTKLSGYDIAIGFRQCEPAYCFILNSVEARLKIGFVHGELTYMGDISTWQKYLEKFDRVVYVSRAVRDQFVQQYPQLEKNACVMHNMLNVELIRKEAEKPCPVCFDPLKKNIVTVARIDNAFKQIDWIPEICRKLKTLTDIPFHWYVVGGGPDYQSVSEQIELDGVGDVLTLVGEQNNPYPFLKNADFSVLTSKSESYGLVIMESFVVACPVVSTAFPALTEIMQDGVDGLMAQMSIEDVTEQIRKMLENENGICDRCKAHLQDKRTFNQLAEQQFESVVSIL